METLLFTVAAAFLIFSLAMVFLGISWLVTGKSRIRPGACGKDPTKKQNEGEDCGNKSSCGVCSKNIESEEQ